MRILARLGAIIIILFIVPSMACAFWLFNLNRVALNQQTYASVPQSPRISSELLQALLDGFTLEGSARNAGVVLNRIPPDAWTMLAADVLPSEKAKTYIERVFSTAFGWLNGEREQLDLGFNLTELKAQLSAEQLGDNIRAIVRSLPPCAPNMVQQLQNFTDASNFDDFPVCRPDDQALLEKETRGLITAFSLVANEMPNSWSFAEELTTFAELPGPPPSVTVPGQGDTVQRINLIELEQMRASIRLQSRLLLLLFLIPVALLCVLIMIRIRSLKAFFRWIGWALVISGIISLLPVFTLPAINSGFSEARIGIALRLGTGGGQALGLFAVQMLEAIVNELTLSVLFQTAGLVVVGLILVFVSVALPHRHDELDEDERARLARSPEMKPAEAQ